ncbi:MULTISPECIES: hypothetical protein [unclassified Leucobacter]|uniref:hypothetical protein n=1 Tax=unclassified Leucobacter TaxID=2621730 RepID=UPI00165D3C92|nr:MULTISPECIES: hypothetical protein [unclassified Leucobacter]MBC9937218.1 hypothetical protein [Leucobacter sp. cx-87]
MNTQLIELGLVVIMAIGIGGCSERPVVSEAKILEHDSLGDQEAWVQSQTEGALAALGPSEGWWVDVPELQWPRDKEKIIRGAETEICRSGPINRRPGRLILDVSNDTYGDPVEGSKRLWNYWEEQGWVVSYVIDPAEQTSGRIDFRADREDGAMLGFSGSPLYSTISINSSCSDDLSVMERY